MYSINQHLSLDPSELEFQAIRAQGAGGQNVNKVSSAVHLRFASQQSSLPSWLKERLLELRDQHVTREGVIVIKAQQYRTQMQNRADAIDRLISILARAAIIEPVRRATKPTYASKKRRLEAKGRRSDLKAGRSKISY